MRATPAWAWTTGPSAHGHRVPAVAAAIELEGLERRYGERSRFLLSPRPPPPPLHPPPPPVALSGVTASVEEGETLTVLGPNGAGKSTLLKVLATLLRPHSGTARVLGAELPA